MQPLAYAVVVLVLTLINVVLDLNGVPLMHWIVSAAVLAVVSFFWIWDVSEKSRDAQAKVEQYRIVFDQKNEDLCERGDVMRERAAQIQLLQDMLRNDRAAVISRMRDVFCGLCNAIDYDDLSTLEKGFWDHYSRDWNIRTNALIEACDV